MKKKILRMPPIYFYMCIILNIVFYFIFKNLNLIRFPFNFAGLLPFTAGFFVLTNSLAVFKKNNTPERFLPVRILVKECFYRYSRNPMYLGGVMILTGIAFVVSNVLAFILPVIFFLIMNFIIIPYEERKNETEIGDDYLEYKKKVRRWL